MKPKPEANNPQRESALPSATWLCLVASIKHLEEAVRMLSPDPNSDALLSCRALLRQADEEMQRHNDQSSPTGARAAGGEKNGGAQ